VHIRKSPTCIRTWRAWRCLCACSTMMYAFWSMRASAAAQSAIPATGGRDIFYDTTHVRLVYCFIGIVLRLFCRLARYAAYPADTNVALISWCPRYDQQFQRTPSCIRRRSEVSSALWALRKLTDMSYLARASRRILRALNIELSPCHLGSSAAPLFILFCTNLHIPHPDDISLLSSVW
jgi:hypothetical protein